MTNASSRPLQLDLIGHTGLKTTRATRSLLDHLDQLAASHDAQNRRSAPISITKKQSEELGKTLQHQGRELRWRSHPLKVVNE